MLGNRENITEKYIYDSLEIKARLFGVHTEADP